MYYIPKVSCGLGTFRKQKTNTSNTQLSLFLFDFSILSSHIHKKKTKKPKFTFKPTLNCPKDVRFLISFECNFDLIWIQNQPKLKSH